MNKNLVQLINAIILLSCYSCNSEPSGNCIKFHNGKFEIRNELDGSVTTIIRNGKRQMEFSPGRPDTIHSSIRWLSECEYQINFLPIDPDSIDSMAQFLQRNTINVKILKTEKDYYIFRASMQGIEQTLTDTIRLID